MVQASIGLLQSVLLQMSTFATDKKDTSTLRHVTRRDHID